MIIGISGKIGSGKDTIGIIIKHLVVNHYRKLDGREELPFSQDWVWDTYPEHNFELKKFADKVKDVVCLLIGCTREQLEDEDFKNTELGVEWWYYKFQQGVTGTFSEQTYWKEYLVPYEGKQLKDKNGFPHSIIKLTPRKLLQLVGTDCGRNIIHPNIWVNSLMSEYKWDGKSMTDGWYPTYNNPDNSGGDIEAEPIMPNWIITDVRFPNEAQAILDRNGLLIRVDRNNPDGSIYGWGNLNADHHSETALDNYDNFKYTIHNNGSIEELINSVKYILSKEKII